MTAVEIFQIEKVGSDYVMLRAGDSQVRVNFASDETFSKEDNAAFFLGLQGKPGAIPVDGPFFIAVDIWRDRFDGSLRVIPFNFAVASIEVCSGSVGLCFAELDSSNSQREGCHPVRSKEGAIEGWLLKPDAEGNETT